MKFSKILSSLTSPTAITIFVAIVLSLFFWFLGPFLGFGTLRPFESLVVRIIVVLIISFGAGLLIILRIRNNKKKDDNLTNDIVAASNADSVTKAATSDLKDMSQKLRTAMTMLRKSKAGRQHLFELPWYIMIGPPGAGKTTAIVNSGLKFPLADELGKEAIGGVGGTRNCDWWFTDKAVLVDTAGRYTTQESNVLADNAAWLGFLRLLKKHRRTQPINGAIVAISLSDLSLQDQTTQQGNAKAVRKRLEELKAELGVNFPVYILFTKADLIAGFAEFFESYGKQEREQVWGFTHDLSNSSDDMSPTEQFDIQFNALLDRLNRLSLDRIQDENDPLRRSLIAGFSTQVASIKSVASDFIDEVFSENKYDDTHFFRGAYFTSGSQEGLPIDRLMQGMAQTFGIGRQSIGAGVGTGRSYFLTKLFDDVIFKESGLVATDNKMEKQYKWFVRGAIVTSVLVSVLLGGIWFKSYSMNNQMLALGKQQIAQYKDSLGFIANEPVSDTDFSSVIPALNVLLNMPGNPAKELSVAPASMKWGLYQGNAVGGEVAQAYRSALNRYLLPRLLLDLEDQLQNNINKPGFLYETMKVYLMLGKQGPMNRDFINEWMSIDLEKKYPGKGKKILRTDLSKHLNSLITQPMQKIELNGPLVKKVQNILIQIPLATRAYNGIINSPKTRSLPLLRVTDIAGPAVDRVFQRSSGEPLNAGIPGVYTYQGFNELFLFEALDVAARIQKEGWVVGSNDSSEITDENLVFITRDVLDLYYNDFIDAYNGLLADLDIIPVATITEAAEIANVLSGPTSPLVKILEAVGKQTALAGSDEGSAASANASVAAGTADSLMGNSRQNMSMRNQILLRSVSKAAQNSGTGDSGSSSKEPGEYVADRFKWVQKFITSAEDQPTKLDKMMKLLMGLYEELNERSFAEDGDTNTGGNIAFKKFKQSTTKMPPPIKRWANQIVGGSSSIASDGTRLKLNKIWKSNYMPFCEQALSNRYPFSRHSKTDVTLQDFGKLFSNNGSLQKFFNEELVKLVDTSSRPWQWKKVNGTDLGISPKVLVNFETAATIRDTFFSNGGNLPSIKFQLKVDKMDRQISKLELTIDDLNLKLKGRGAGSKPVAVKWPGEVGVAGLSLFPKINWNNTEVTTDGPWAFYRLLDMAEIQGAGSSDRTKIIFQLGRREIILNLLSGSVLNPFSLKGIAAFSCPKGF